MIQLQRIEEIRDVQLGAQVMTLCSDVELLLGTVISVMLIGDFQIRDFKCTGTLYYVRYNSLADAKLTLFIRFCLVRQ